MLTVVITQRRPLSWYLEAMLLLQHVARNAAAGLLQAPNLVKNICKWCRC